MHQVKSAAWVSLALANVAFAHISLFHPAMYCFNGTDPNGNPDNNGAPVTPLYNLPYDQYWMHHVNGCDKFPPDEGVFMELTSGSTFWGELAANRAFTTFNTDPNRVVGTGIDGQNYGSDFGFSNGSCIVVPNMHTHNLTTVTGTSLAIAYKSDITTVGIEDLVVISVNDSSPFFRETAYDIPADLPGCPTGGCICTVSGICGQPNMYMFPFKCKVITNTPTPKTIGAPKPAVWCGDDSSQCVKGAKQIMIWHQAEGNNIEVSGLDQHGQPKFPAYNPTCGFTPGAQNDIFVSSNDPVLLSPSSVSSSSLIPSSSPVPSTPPVLDSSPYPSSVPPNWSSIPSGSGWPGTFGDPTPCSEPQPSNSGDPANQRSKRMHHRRETRNVF